MTTDRARLVDAHLVAAACYRDCLHSPLGNGPRCYLTARGVGPGLVDGGDWTIGYAPPGWTAVVSALRAHRFTDTELLESGLAVSTRRGTLIDRFRDRVMFGLHDHVGTLVGFTGRAAPRAAATATAASAAAAAAAGAPKYLNSPTTVLYDKSRLLFGLAEQRDLLKAGARPLLVEGPFDILTVAGLGHALGLDVAPVAACGTALSPAQAAQLRPYLGHGALVGYDGDAAGLRAALTAYTRLSPYTTDLRAVRFAPGDDPARLAATSPRTLASLIETAPPLATHLLRARVAPFLGRLDNAEVCAAALHAATRLLGQLHPPDAAGQVAWLAEHLGYTTAEVTRDLTDALSALAPGRVPSTNRQPRAVVHSRPAGRAAQHTHRLE